MTDLQDSHPIYLEHLLQVLRRGLQSKEEVQFVLPEFGRVLVPMEFHDLVSVRDPITVQETRTPPREILHLIHAGFVVVLTGDFRRIAGILTYLSRHKDDLIPPTLFAHVANRFERSKATAQAARVALHRLMVVFRGDRIQRVHHAPDLRGLMRYLEGDTAYLRDRHFLLPVRKALRIATDIQRFREGVWIPALGGRLYVFPHVFVPSDQKVVTLLADHLDVRETDRVLDMGTGTGLLALIVARKGAHTVVATDNNPAAVNNARFNVEHWGLTERIDVRGPAHLFEGLQGERFDVMLFNAPWIEGEPKTLYETAIYDKDYAVITEFIQRAPDHLTSEGRVLLQYSKISQLTGHGSIQNLHDLIEANGLTIVQRWSTARLGRVLGDQERLFLYDIRRKP